MLIGEKRGQEPNNGGNEAVRTGSGNHADDTVPYQRVTAKRPGRAADSDMSQRDENDV
jgi:hypothetical protein